jgi:hypothetical protein
VAEERFKLPLIDVASVVVAPALVMGMVGSLVFFLIEVLQAGRFEGRLHYTFFFFVFGAVLIARIAIQRGSKIAGLYAVGLGGACFVAMLAFVEYTTPLFKAIGPVINIGLMALVWWSAHKLTWDCTHLEEGRKASGRGVLAAAGLDGTKATTAADDDQEYDPDRSRQVTKKRTSRDRKGAETQQGWLERFQKYREWRKNRPHTPGVWVLYFSLAAIPLFALGQSVIPAEDSARRASTFWQMAVYVGCGLGLLVTTTLMGLRRYLEDRKASIPTAMTAAWLGMGAVLILLFLAVGAVLPRPHSETPLYTFQKGGKTDRQASKNAVVKDNSAGKGDGAAGQRKEAGDGNTNAKGGKQGGQGDGNKSQGQGSKQGNQGNNQGNRQGEKGDGNKGNDSGGDKSDGKKGEQNNNGNNRDPSRKDPNDGQRNKQDQGKPQDGESKGEQSDDQKADSDTEQKDGSSGGPAEKLRELTQGLEKISDGLKWVVWVVLAVAFVVGIVYFGLKYLSNFTGWAQGLLDWLRGLLGRKPKPKGVTTAEEAEEEVVERPPPFSRFDNPFTDGTAKRRDTRELTAYTFAALEAWAWDHDAGRPPDETPAEFAARLAEEYPRLEKPAADVANLHVRAMFSPGELPADAKQRLAKAWAVLEGAAEPAGVE